MIRFRNQWVRCLAVAVAMLAALALCRVSDASDHGGGHSGGGGHGGGGHGEPAAEVEIKAYLAPGAKHGGIELGEFRIRAYYPVEAQKSTVHFVLYAMVGSEQFAEMQKLIENRRNKLRDEVITVARLVPLALYDEPELTSFRRRILLRLRRALPELSVDDVYINDFQLTVKSL